MPAPRQDPSRAWTLRPADPTSDDGLPATRHRRRDRRRHRADILAMDSVPVRFSSDVTYRPGPIKLQPDAPLLPIAAVTPQLVPGPAVLAPGSASAPVRAVTPSWAPGVLRVRPNAPNVQVDAVTPSWNPADMPVRSTAVLVRPGKGTTWRDS